MTAPPCPTSLGGGRSRQDELRIVEAYDAGDGDGDKGALLRREGLYSSHIVEWRRASDAAARSGLTQPRRATISPDATALAKANRKIERLESDVAMHKLALEISGIDHALLEKLAESAQDEHKPRSDRRLLRRTAPAGGDRGRPSGFGQDPGHAPGAAGRPSGAVAAPVDTRRTR